MKHTAPSRLPSAVGSGATINGSPDDTVNRCHLHFISPHYVSLVRRSSRVKACLSNEFGRVG